MSDITYYNIATGQIQGNFKNIDLTTYPDIPSDYIDGIYDGRDYYISGGLPVLKTQISTPTNTFLMEGSVDKCILSIPNPTDVFLIQEREFKEDSFESYSETVTDGTFEITSSLSGSYKITATPTDITYKPLTFLINVIPDHAVVITNYNVSFNTPSIKQNALLKPDIIEFNCNFYTPIINAQKLISITSPINYTSSFITPIINCKQSITGPTLNYNCEFKTPQINAQSIIYVDTITSVCDFILPNILVIEQQDLSFVIDTIDVDATMIAPLINAQWIEPTTTLTYNCVFNTPLVYN